MDLPGRIRTIYQVLLPLKSSPLSHLIHPAKECSASLPNGDAFGTNLSMPAFARSISGELEYLVVDKTGLTGSYDFRVKADQPNEGGAVDGIRIALTPLALTLKPGTGSIETIVIENVTQPTPD